MNVLWYADLTAFRAINGSWHTPAADCIASALSGLASFGILWILVAAVIIWREERRDHWFFVPLIGVMATAWTLAEAVIKPLVGRVRPAFMAGTVVVPPVPHGYSFPSTHAAVAFAAAYLISRRDSRLTSYIYILAGLVAVSRIYLGHHYPSDVVAGMALGTFVGWTAVKLNGTNHTIKEKRHL